MYVHLYWYPLSPPSLPPSLPSIMQGSPSICNLYLCCRTWYSGTVSIRFFPNISILSSGFCLYLILQIMEHIFPKNHLFSNVFDPSVPMCSIGRVAFIVVVQLSTAQVPHYPLTSLSSSLSVARVQPVTMAISTAICPSPLWKLSWKLLRNLIPSRTSSSIPVATGHELGHCEIRT